MSEFKAEFYENGDEIPVKEFLDSLDNKMRAKFSMEIKLLEEKGNQLREPIVGMKVEENVSGLHYTRFTVDEARNFKDYMYYHPIPLKVIKESPSIQQNPGW